MFEMVFVNQLSFLTCACQRNRTCAMQSGAQSTQVGIISRHLTTGLTMAKRIRRTTLAFTIGEIHIGGGDVFHRTARSNI